MRVLVYMGHPAHFYNYKNAILSLREDGHKVEILIKKKDVLQSLLDNAGFSYHNILKEGRGDTRLGIIWGTLKRAWRLNAFCSRFHPDVLTGTSVENSWIGKLRSIPVININEDDASVVPYYARLSYPWASVILSPLVCNNGKWEKKTVKYNGYHELAYLHPDHFMPDRSIVEKYVSSDSPFFLIRVVRLKALHDAGKKGIGPDILQRIIDTLEPYGRVLISSERELEPQFRSYRVHIDPLDMHHILAFASLFIGDSQTMAAEAGVLGTPFVRFNDFVGRLSYLDELENVYHLGNGHVTSDVDGFFDSIHHWLDTPDRKTICAERRQRMLADKIDFARFLTWFLEEYPDSKRIMFDTPDFQFRFRTGESSFCKEGIV